MAAQQSYTSYADYAAQEGRSDERHEWRDGLVVAMAGGTPRHGMLAARIIAALDGALRGRPCQVMSSDVKVRILPTKLGTYPDASVVCGPIETDSEDRNSILNPSLLVEVLSDSTEAYDRGAKFAHYRALASLRAVLFVRQASVGLELYVKRSDGEWTFLERTSGKLFVEPLDIALDVDDIYREPLPEV